MTSTKSFREQRWFWPLLILAAAGLAWLMLYRLGPLSGGLSGGERRVAVMAYGWRNLYEQPWYLPLTLVRTIDFSIFPRHGQTLTRLPNALFGALTIITFGCLLRLWHGARTAALGTVLFACGAWTLHASRLASNDVLYLWSLPTVLLVQLAVQRWSSRALVFYGSLVSWLVLLYIPGMVWIVALSVFWSRTAWWQGWSHFKSWWQHGLYVLLVLPFLGLLAKDFFRPGNFKYWLGLPRQFPSPLTLVKHFLAVPLHLSVRGPEYPTLWLGRAPLLDIFTLTAALLGIYFYARHWQAGRSRLLLSLFIVSWLLVGLGGPVGLSLLVPLLYLCAAAGIAYLLREWLQVFPRNPLARGLGYGLIILAVSLSAGYNLRAYFIAWAHDPVTRVTFDYRR